MKFLITISLVIFLSGCIPEVPDVPTAATCTADGWRVDPLTGEIITGDDDGAAIKCEFN